MAEGILRNQLAKFNIHAHIDSCGFESFHVGDAPDSRAQSVARKYGVDLSSHRARLFSTDDFDRFDMIFAMDSSHYQNIMRCARKESDKLKVDYMLNVLYPGQNMGVMDPWYHDQKAFEKVYVQLEAACQRLVDRIVAESLQK
jgi:protein-tyrosine phosphatase